MAKTTVVMSLSVPPETPKDLDGKAAAQDYASRSKLAVALFEDFANLNRKTHDILRRAADQRGVPVSELVEFLVDRFSIEDDTVKPIVLKVPLTVTRDPASLRSWLDQKVDAIVNHLYPSHADR